MINVVVGMKYTPRVGPAERAVLQLPNKLRGLRTVLATRISPLFANMEERHFVSKGAAFGHAWAPWAPATLRKRTRKGNAGLGILTDTNVLHDSLTKDFSPSNATIATTDRSFLLTFSTRIPYAIFHQLGAPANNMPIRQVIPSPLPESFKRQVRSVLRGWLMDNAAENAG